MAGPGHCGGRGVRRRAGTVVRRDAMTLSRRALLKGAAGAAAFARAARTAAQEPGIRVAGRLVGVHISAVGEYSLRVGVVPIENGEPVAMPQDGSLLPRRWEEAARITSSLRATNVP